MKTLTQYITLFLMLLTFKSIAKSNDIYLVFYATINGKSGHVGLAVDNYKIIVKDIVDENHNYHTVYDTIKTQTLTYYDLWPVKDSFNASNVNKNVPSVYYKLPAASWESPITIQSLIKTGIPHEEHYPVDGLIRISSTPQKDKSLKIAIEKLISINKPFNVRTFNCADFVEMIIEMHCKCNIEADESIILRSSTTPNRLYQEVTKLKNTSVLKDGSNKAKGAFTIERLLKRNNS